MPNAFNKMVSKLTWDRGGTIRKAIQDGYGHPPNVAAKLGMTESEMWAKHKMFRKDIEAAMKEERDVVMAAFNRACETAVLDWLFEATSHTRIPDNKLSDAIRGHILYLLRGKANAA